MRAEITKRLFTAEEYQRMGEAGILSKKDRVELIEGEIIQMSPIGHPHWVSVGRITVFFIEAFGRNAFVSIQGPIRLSEWTEPEPDCVVFKPRADFYKAKRPTPDDVLFIVEVADSFLSYDKKVKVPLYAKAGIPEVWIADLKNDQLLVFRELAEGKYATQRKLTRGESISPMAFPDITFRVEDILG